MTTKKEMMELVDEYLGNHTLMNDCIAEQSEDSAESQYYIDISMKIRTKLESIADELERQWKCPVCGAEISEATLSIKEKIL